MQVSTWLDKYRECEVEVLYLTDNNVYRDRGRLADFDDRWIELRKTGNETFLIPITAVRLMKLLNPPETMENLLLRPVETPPADEQRTVSRRIDAD
jgi:hypothetical protein